MSGVISQCGLMLAPEESTYCCSLIKRLSDTRLLVLNLSCVEILGFTFEPLNIFAEGSCSPHHRGAPRRPRWDATASLTANHSPRNRKCQQHRRKRPRTPLWRTGKDHLDLQNHPPPSGQMSDRGFPSRPLTTS